MIEKIHKRITSATKYIFVIFSICLIFLFHKIENKNSSEEFVALNKINKEITLMILSTPTNNEMDERLRQWLSEKYPKKYTTNYFSRLILSRFLLNHGIDSTKLHQVKDIKNSYSSFTLTRMSGDLKLSNNNGSGPPPTFNKDIDLYIEYTKLRDVTLVTDIDTLLINFNYVVSKLKRDNKGYLEFLEKMNGHKFSKSDREETLNDPSFVDLSINALLEADSIKLQFYPLNDQMSQRSFIPIKLLFPIKSEKLYACLSYQELLGHEKSQIDSSIMKNLKNIYGGLPRDVANKQITEKYLNYYNNLDVLGFSIPSHFFYLIVFIFQIMIGISLLNSMSIAFKNKCTNMFSVIDDDLFEPLINNKFCRFIVWVLISIFNIIVSFPLIKFQFVTSYICLFCITVLLFLTVFYYSLKLNGK